MNAGSYLCPQMFFRKEILNRGIVKKYHAELALSLPNVTRRCFL